MTIKSTDIHNILLIVLVQDNTVLVGFKYLHSCCLTRFKKERRQEFTGRSYNN